MKRFPQTLLAALLCLLPSVSQGQDSSRQFVAPKFLLPPFYPNPGFSDYRPVLNAAGNMVIFERTLALSSVTMLYSANISTGAVQLVVPFLSFRADWCWLRSGNGGLTSGPVAFSNDQGIYRLDSLSPTLLPNRLSLLRNTAGSVYPSWYPDCNFLAVDVDTHVTAKINAVTGQTIIPVLANGTVWAGFPSVNQANPNLVAFAGQYNQQGSNYYDEDLNYIWVTNGSTNPPTVAPLDQQAPAGSGFLQIFQGRAGWWSPDGNWFAFESNRICNQIDGQTYAIFIQDATGTNPSLQVSDCQWNAQHPKWFPPGSTGAKTLLIAAVAQAGMGQNFAIASFDVSAFVGNQ
jgi:hypothetical protein